MAENTIREQIIAVFRERLGEPEVSDTRRGSMYYWTLQRGRYEIPMYVTIDSPEWTDMAHVLISDSRQFQTDPVVSITVYTLDEARVVIERIHKQWKQTGEGESPPQESPGTEMA